MIFTRLFFYVVFFADGVVSSKNTVQYKSQEHYIINY